jgi:hypothetical protein
MRSGRRFRLEIEALVSDWPVEIRLRQALKRLLRGYGFECVRIQEITESTPVPDTEEDRPHD